VRQQIFVISPDAGRLHQQRHCDQQITVDRPAKYSRLFETPGTEQRALASGDAIQQTLRIDFRWSHIVHSRQTLAQYSL
jgi:hypothetical protein